jgi:hypothetical protein
MTYLAICAVYRDEAPYLSEWLEFHRIVGVERFFLYNNRSTDDHAEVLAPYVADGLVMVHDCPDVPAALRVHVDCIERHRDDARWIAFIDIDEFLFSPTGRTVPEVLEDYEKWPAVVVNLAWFGTSGHVTKPSGLVIENYVRRAADGSRRNRIVKSIVDPRRVLRPGPNTNYFLYTDGHAVDELGRSVQSDLTESPTFERLRINHYVTKSEAEARIKLSRPEPMHGVLRAGAQARLRKRDRELSALPDDTILSYAPAVREAVSRATASRYGREPSTQAARERKL